MLLQSATNRGQFSFSVKAGQPASNRGQVAIGTELAGPPSGDFIAIGDLNGDGQNDIVVNDGPSVLLQHATAPGTFHPLAPLRAASVH